MTTWRYTILLLFCCSSMLSATRELSAAPISALTSTGQIVNFDSATPGTVISTISVSGLTSGQALVGIDYRPIDSALIGFAYNSATGASGVYTISPTGVATSINSVTLATGLARITTDFNPTANALRIVTSGATGNNLRIPTGGTGALTADTDLNPANTNIRSTAYSRNNAGGGTSGATTLYVIDGTNNSLSSVGSVDFFTGSGTSPNTGTLSPIATLTGVTGSTIVGFDIFNGLGTAATTPGSAFLASGTTLYSLNLSTGAATTLGTFSGFTAIDIAAIPEPSSLVLLGIATVGGIALWRKHRAATMS